MLIVSSLPALFKLGHRKGQRFLVVLLTLEWRWDTWSETRRPTCRRTNRQKRWPAVACSRTGIQPATAIWRPRSRRALVATSNSLLAVCHRTNPVARMASSRRSTGVRQTQSGPRTRAPCPTWNPVGWGYGEVDWSRAGIRPWSISRVPGTSFTQGREALLVVNKRTNRGAGKQPATDRENSSETDPFNPPNRHRQRNVRQWRIWGGGDRWIAPPP